METLRGWVVSVTAMALLSAICRGLMPEGPARRVGGMACALLLFLVIVTPAARLRVEDLPRKLGEAVKGYEVYSSDLEKADRSLTAELVARQCAAHLEQRAAERDCACTVVVFCGEREGVCVPERAEISGALTGEQQSTITELAVTELGLEEGQVVFLG